MADIEVIARQALKNRVRGDMSLLHGLGWDIVTSQPPDQ
jgi:hypothetical protein